MGGDTVEEQLFFFKKLALISEALLKPLSLPSPSSMEHEELGTFGTGPFRELEEFFE